MEKAGQKHMQQLEHQRRFWMLPEVHRNMSNCWKVMANSIKTRHNGKKLSRGAPPVLARMALLCVRYEVDRLRMRSSRSASPLSVTGFQQPHNVTGHWLWTRSLRLHAFNG